MKNGGLRTQGLNKISNDKEVLISVITVVFNGKDFIEKTIKNVLAQTYKNIEYIIIDGASNDGTLDIIKKYEDKIDYWQSEQDKGIYDAMNKGVSLAKGEFIHFLNAGDLFCSNDIIKKMFSVPNNYKDVDILYGYHLPSKYKQKTLTMVGFFFDKTICHQALFARRDTFWDNEFDINYRIVADRKWLFRNYKKGKKFKFVDVPVVLMDQNGVSSNFNNFYSEFKKLKYEEFGAIGLLVLELKHLFH